MAAVKKAEPIFLIEELSNATMQTISSKYHFSPTYLHLRLLGRVISLKFLNPLSTTMLSPYDVIIIRLYHQ